MFFLRLCEDGVTLNYIIHWVEFFESFFGVGGPVRYHPYSRLPICHEEYFLELVEHNLTNFIHW